MSDEQAILLSDIFPTGYQAAEMAQIRPGDVVCVLGCGPVGQFAIWSALHLGAGRVIAVDSVPDRLSTARNQGAEIVDFGHEDPVELVKEMTRGIGPDRVIDAVGVDANAGARPASPSVEHAQDDTPERVPPGSGWHPGEAPSEAARWAVEMVAKAGTVSLIGVYPPTVEHFPIGQAFMKNVSLNMGNCNHRRYLPMLLELVRSGAVSPTDFIAQRHPMESAAEAFRTFERREPGWLKVELRPVA